MKQHYHYLFLLCSLLLSCGGEIKRGDLPEIPVDIEQNRVSQLSLSEIAEEITAIEPELTDESLINPRHINRIILSDDLVIIAQSEIILVFDRNGKFVRSIGSKGQGPGEYNSIRSLALDETNKRLFVNAWEKIICYDLEGNYVRESSIFRLNNGGSIIDINHINNELFTIIYSPGREDENGQFNHSALYRLNDELQITDSCTIRNVYGRPGFSTGNREDYILHSDSTVYLYYIYPYGIELARLGQNTSKAILRDTLYRFENNHLIPELKLKFKNDGIGGDGYLYISIQNVYRSSRYIFAEYYDVGVVDSNNRYAFHSFCHDTKTGKGFNVRDGYTDDIHQITQVTIRPFHTNPEMFYYWHTHMDDDDLEEPNPTLYIGKLKK